MRARARERNKEKERKRGREQNYTRRRVSVEHRERYINEIARPVENHLSAVCGLFHRLDGILLAMMG